MEHFRFGLLADIQYADRPMQIGRYYRNALHKTNRCMEVFNRSSIDFCVHLGDLIDWPGNPEKGREALDTIMPAMNSFNGPTYYLLGNHDVDSVPRNDLAMIMGMADGQTWYSFDHKGIHFVALDCNFDATGAPYQPGKAKWDHCYLPSEELSWLEADLSVSQSEVVVLMVHALLDDMDNKHVIKNAAEIRSILERCDKRVVVFQGHMHTGYESIKNGISYHTLRSIVDGRTRTCFWIVEVRQNEMIAYVYDSVLYRSKPRKQHLIKIENQPMKDR